MLAILTELNVYCFYGSITFTLSFPLVYLLSTVHQVPAYALMMCSAQSVSGSVGLCSEAVAAEHYHCLFYPQYMKGDLNSHSASHKTICKIFIES